MRQSFILLTLADTLLLILTAWTGHRVQGEIGFPRHFLMGLIAALFTCLVHLVAFVYFMVQDKIIKQSVLLNGLDVAYATQVDRHKVRVLAASMAGIASVCVISALGGAPGTWHAMGGYALPAVNLLFAFREYREIVAYRDLFRAAFSE